MKVEIIRKMTTPNCHFTEHFRNFENVEVVQRIFGNRTQHVLTNLHIKFTNGTLNMGVDHDGHLLINPEYFETADFTDLYLDAIHELVHVNKFLTGRTTITNYDTLKDP